MMYCSKCGNQIHEEAVICPQFGCPTINYYKNNEQAPVNIVNAPTATSHSTVVVKERKRHSLLFDLFMTVITGGLWLIWVVIRAIFGW